MRTIARSKQDGDWMWINCEFWRTWAWWLAPATVRVYAVLAMHANNTTQSAFLHQAAIAKEAHCSPRSVVIAVDELRMWSLIGVARGRHGNTYTLLQPRCEADCTSARSEAGCTSAQSEAPCTCDVKPAALGDVKPTALGVVNSDSDD